MDLHDEINEGRAPRITPAHLRSIVHNQEYTVLSDGRTTICQLTLRNGFTVLGMSACVSKDNFDKVKGETYAYENAYSKLWELEGYLLAERLYRGEIG